MVVGIAGLPGCGKSWLITEYEAKGFAVFDDINANKKGGWIQNIMLVRSLIAAGKDVAISDIMFCEDGWRDRLQNDLAAPIHWICFENNPHICAKNCRHRASLNPHQILAMELAMIERLAPAYHPVGEIRPVVDAQQAAARS